MPELTPWSELRGGGVVVPGEAERPQTGGWRTGVELDGTTFSGFDLTYCKGCEICAEVCPVDAVTMVPEEVAS